MHRELSSITLPAVKEKDTLTLGIYNATGTLVKAYSNQKILPIQSIPAVGPSHGAERQKKDITGFYGISVQKVLRPM